MPTLPSVSLKAMSFSPKTCSLTGVLSALGTSSANITGSQKRRNSSPMGVPGPTCVINSLSSRVSIRSLS